MKRSKQFLIVGLLAAISGIVGYSFRPVPSNEFEMSKNIEIFGAVYKELNAYYVDEPMPGKLMKDGIDAMLESLDPYTVFYPESDIEDYRFMTTGQYGGIGAVIRKNGEYSQVAEPYEGYPAMKAGLIAGDMIYEIDGKSIKGMTSDEVSRFLKGAPGTSLKLKVKREGTEGFMEKTLVREEIKIKDVPYYGMIDQQTGYIKLNSFTNTASAEVKDAFKNLKEKHGMKQLVFDLRGNGGGLLTEAVAIVNIFVPRGTEIVRQKGRMPNMNAVYPAKEEPLDLNMPLVVLIDEGSASASEIVSGSIQDLDRGVVVGQRSYGKGLVQQTRTLPYNSMMKLTVAKYYTPSGRCIQKLDYSHKDQSGKATVVSDSLIKKFKTKNGREVFDGRGIDPDVNVEMKEYSRIVASLYAQNIIFDYATKFHRENNSITNAKEFRFTDAQYNDFLAFVKNKEYSYKTMSEEKFEELKKTAEREKYFQGAESEFEALLKKVQPSKETDLMRFKDEIIEFIESEIVGRYYYQNGKIEHTLRTDPEIIEAIKIFNDPSRYKGILNGSIKTDKK
ncbi:MAG: S41 family peptidase [Flavobacteriales bacterium]|nr:S41 family peptidase [Flavobacteriales bacterium]